MPYRPLLIKVGTRARATRPGFGALGTITRVFPERGMYWLATSGGTTYPVGPRTERIEIEPPDRRGY